MLPLFFTIKVVLNVFKADVKAGDDVIEGQELLVLEAMKMENPIVSTAAGKVKEVNVSVDEKSFLPNSCIFSLQVRGDRVQVIGKHPERCKQAIRLKLYWKGARGTVEGDVAGDDVVFPLQHGVRSDSLLDGKSVAFHPAALSPEP